VTKKNFWSLVAIGVLFSVNTCFCYMVVETAFSDNKNRLFLMALPFGGFGYFAIGVLSLVCGLCSKKRHFHYWLACVACLLAFFSVFGVLYFFDN
jgi:hypothetical protein